MKLKEQYLRNLVSKSLYIHELRDKKVVCRESAQAPARFKLWESRVGSSVFQQRLRLEDISGREALYLCGEPYYIATVLPQWTKTLKSVFAVLPTSYERILEEIDPQYCRDTYPAIIGNCFLIFAVIAKRRLAKYSNQVSGVFYETLCKDLMDRLCFIGGTAMHDYVYKWIASDSQSLSSIETWMGAKPCDFLLAGGYLEFFAEYPMLARLVCESLDTWTQNMDDMISRALRNIRGDGRPISITGGISDLHNGGKNVYILEYENGKKYVYKPRSLKTDLAWRNLCVELQEQTGIGIRHVEALDCGSYGFCEFIEYKSADTHEERKQFFENAGSVLCILYLLRARDMHNDNVICHGDKLVVIDMETIAQSDTDTYSIINTAMLNTWVERQRSVYDFLDTENDNPEDLGGLTHKLPHTKNLPVSENTVYTAKDYINEVYNGFEKMYGHVMNNSRIALKEHFKACNVRFLFRKTTQYFDLLISLYDSEHLKDGFIYSCEVERLSTACTPDYFAAYISEREAILKGDTPVFCQKAETRDLCDGKGVVIKDYFKHMVFDIMTCRKINDEDKQRQLEKIQKVQ